MIQGAISHANFPTLCANLQSNREELQTPQGAVSIKSSNGVKFRIAGVVTTFDGGHPEGSNEVYEGLSFIHPFDAATEALSVAKRGEIRLLLSHMGDDKDLEYAAVTDCCDVIIGGHTHALLDTLVNGTIVGQTGNKLRNVGVTRVTMRGRKVVNIEYENISIKNYDKSAKVEQMIDVIEANPDLELVVGSMAKGANHVGLCNLQTKIIKEATGADIGIYHRGGVRLKEGLAAGDVTIKDITFDNANVNSNSINTSILTVQTYQNVTLDNVDVKNSTIIGGYKVAPLIATVYNENPSTTITATLQNCDVTNTTVKATSYDFCTTGMVAFVYAGDNDKIEFENCTVSNVKLYAPNGYTAHAAIYTTGSETLYNEADGVTVTNVTFENI